MKPIVLLFLIAGWLASPTTPASRAEEKIITTRDLLDAAEREFKKADAAMNAAYRELLRYLDPKETESLRAAQRAWLVFSDAEVKFGGLQFEGGTLQPVAMVNTLTLLTNERTAHLRLHKEERASTRSPVSPAKPTTKPGPK